MEGFAAFSFPENQRKILATKDVWYRTVKNLFYPIQIALQVAEMLIRNFLSFKYGCFF